MANPKDNSITRIAARDAASRIHKLSAFLSEGDPLQRILSEASKTFKDASSKRADLKSAEFHETQPQLRDRLRRLN